MNAEPTTEVLKDYASCMSDIYLIDKDLFLKTLECESSFNTQAVGDSGTSFGIAQIHLPAHPDITKEQALDPFWAIQWSAEHFKERPQAWSCYRLLTLVR